MQKSNILKFFVLLVFVAAIVGSLFSIRIKTKEAYADDIFVDLSAKMDQVLDTQKIIQSDIANIKNSLNEISQKLEK